MSRYRFIEAQHPHLIGRGERGLAEEQVFGYDRRRVGHRGAGALRPRA